MAAAYHTVIIIDAAFGSLHYAVWDYPTATRVHRAYTPPHNHRPRINPLVVAVFAQSAGQLGDVGLEWASSVEADGTFNVRTFMLNNQLAGRECALCPCYVCTFRFDRHHLAPDRCRRVRHRTAS
jgi:hypothetical protein